MNVQIDDWVVRNAYPVVREGFQQTYEHVLPNALNRVIAIDNEREAITLHVFCDGKYYEEEFWAGNFRKSTTTPCLGTSKLGSLIYSQFDEGECDFCASAVSKEILAELREAYPWWFSNDGKGSLLTEHMAFHAKKCRVEFTKRVKKERVWQFSCGFCDEPFGVCAFHLKEILQELQ